MTVSVSHLSAMHAMVTCVNTSAGQAVCSGTSTGFLAGLGVILFIYLALAVLGIVAAVKIVTKAGYSGWWVLIAFVPIVGTVFVLIFAFSTWPVTREVQHLRAQMAGAGGYAGFGDAHRMVAPGPGFGHAPPVSESESAGSPGSGVSDPTAGPDAIPSFGQFLQGDPVVTATTLAPTGAEAAPLPPAGWFPAPGGGQGRLRYWDGATWTDQER